MIIIDNKKNIRSFGRIHTKNLSNTDKNLLDNSLKKYSFELKDNMDLKNLFNNINNPIYLEIGFGYGESLAERAKASPDINFIGCEAYEKGIANLLKQIEKYDLKNVLIFQGDARLLLEKITDHSIDKIFLLFPDPWPKAKQNKRRIVNLNFVELIHTKLKQNGIFFFASDIPSYVNWTLDIITSTKLIYKQLSNTEKEPNWWITTKYQKKAIAENRKTTFLEFEADKL